MTIIWCMVPEIWSMTDRFFCHFGPFFCPFTPLSTQKIKTLKNFKNAWKYYFYTCALYDVWYLRYGAWSFCHFGPFFVLLTPLTTQKMKKMKKIPLEIYHFTYVYHKLQSYDVQFLRYANIPTVPTLVCCLAVLDWINLSWFLDFSPKIFYIHFIFHQQCNNLHK